MTAAAALAFPGGRTLAGWWRQLAPWQPRNLWVGHLLLHRVEALVRLTRQMPLASLDHSLLQAMRVVRVPTAQALDECLRLGRQVLGQLLGQLGKSGLAEHNSAGHWTPTVLGGAALTTGHYAATSHERRAFYFRESEQRGCLP